MSNLPEVKEFSFSRIEYLREAPTDAEINWRQEWGSLANHFADQLYEAYLLGCNDLCIPEPLTREQFLAKWSYDSL